MDKLAEKLSTWFGSTPFIVFHIIWFSAWTISHFAAKFDSDWSTLTLIVSLEAIFLSLFILRAETIQSARFERKVDKDVRSGKEVLRLLEGLTLAHADKSAKK